MSINKPFQSKSLLIILGLAAITGMLKIGFQNSPELVERLYYKGIYKWFRYFWDLVFSWCPIPLFYFWLTLLSVLIIVLLRNLITNKDGRIKSLKRFIILLSIHFIWFYWTWGFNYGRMTLGHRWEINTTVNENQFLKEFYNETRLLDSMRLQFKTSIDNYQFNSKVLENEIRNLASEFMHENGFLVFDHVRCRNLSLKGILLIWSTSGVYMPFVGESQFDGGLHNLSKPFTMAHEFCHGMGWTHEGDCNFMAYLICKKSNDPLIRYSGELNYWRYLYANASRAHPEQFKQVRSNLSAALSNDLKEINAANDYYPEIFPKLRSWLYDWYLKNNGIASGDKSYSEIIRMVINYKNKGTL